MKFSDFICREAIRGNMSAVDKQGAIREMVQSLVDAKRVNAAEFESIVKAILKREELGSTGIGRGVAVPAHQAPQRRSADRHRRGQPVRASTSPASTARRSTCFSS